MRSERIVGKKITKVTATQYGNEIPKHRIRKEAQEK